MRSDCADFADLLDAELDEALPPATRERLASHLAGCPACTGELAALRGLRAELATLREEAPPPALEPRILALLPAAPRRRALLAPMAAGLAGLVLGAGGMRLWGAGTAPPPAGHDLVMAHARGLLAGLPLQVASSDVHQVRPWLSAHLPVAPQVLEAEGFPLLGARLDLVAGQVVAAMLYRRREHVITVFAAGPETARGWPTAPGQARGFRLLPWIAGGLHYLAVSDLNAAELAELRTALGG